MVAGRELESSGQTARTREGALGMLVDAVDVDRSEREVADGVDGIQVRIGVGRLVAGRRRLFKKYTRPGGCVSTLVAYKAAVIFW